MTSFKCNRGSVLIVAFIFAAILAIALASYLKLSLNTAKLSNRSFYLNAAQNLADTGLERALWSLNNKYRYPSPSHWAKGGFAERTGYPNEYQGTFPSTGDYTLSGGVKGRVKVWLGDFIPASQTWHVVAQATITLGDGSTLSKTAECYLQQRAWSEGGVVTRNGMTFTGNVQVDSWNSHSDTVILTDDVPYSVGIAEPKAQIGSPSLIELGNADVYGFASIGSTDLSGITRNADGRLAGLFTAGPGIDATRVTCNFTASFPDIPAPTTTAYALGAVTSTQSLPRAGDVPIDGVYYYHVSSISIGADKSITIGAASAVKVVLVVSNDMAMGGESKLIINPDSSLKIYAGRNFTMTGESAIINGVMVGGVFIPNNPLNFTLVGTRTEAEAASLGMQAFNIRGGGGLSAVIYASNANLTVNGDADVYGSLVGNRVNMVGEGKFHQDLSLENVRTTGVWKMLKWRELFAAPDRATYASHMSF